jgi:hypothetical protein
LLPTTHDARSTIKGKRTRDRRGALLSGNAEVASRQANNTTIPHRDAEDATRRTDGREGSRNPKPRHSHNARLAHTMLGHTIGRAQPRMQPANHPDGKRHQTPCGIRLRRCLTAATEDHRVALPAQLRL